MEKRTIDALLLVARAGLALAGALFLLLAMLSGDETHGTLLTAVLCFLLAGLFHGLGRTEGTRGDERP